jgi:hypothetical protein
VGYPEIERVTKRVSERELTHKKIDRAREEISRYSRIVQRFLSTICGPNGVVRKEEGGKTPREVQ